MIEKNSPLISVVVPLYNEVSGLGAFHNSLVKCIDSIVKSDYEIIYCDDGSTDDTVPLLQNICHQNHQVKLIRFSRNFGKENALLAGIARATGQAIITLDGDGQHPIDLLPKFVELWKQGAQVVVGIRSYDNTTGWTKRLTSAIFYKVFNMLTTQQLIPGSTDFRLINRDVQKEFLKLKETNRINRGLIDWLGFDRKYIYFDSNPRTSGRPSYGTHKLLKLAADSFVSLSPTPLYIFGFLGVFITSSSFILGTAVLIEQYILNDPLGWKFTGTSSLGILTLFLVGIILMSQGILSLYLSHIHSQSKARPLYVIDYAKSIGIKTND